jgi:serine/threonine-protein kinase
VVLSPDGNRIVFVGWDRNGVSRLFTRRLDQIDASEIPGTEGAHAPLFSPDGAWVAFTSMRDRKLKKVNVTAGSPIDLASVTDVFGASWGDNDEIVVKLDATPRLWRVPTNGGTPTAIPNVQLPNDADPHVWMQVLPGSRSLILTVALQRGFDTAEIAAVSLTDGSLKTLVRGGTFGRYAPSGHLVYVNQGTLYASPFNLDRMELRGSPKPVLGGLDYNRLFGYAQFDWSRTGLLAYRRSASAGHFDVYWIEGSRKRLAVDRPRRYSWPRISPDGNKLALVREESSGSSLWIETAKPAQSLQITSGDGVITSPVWSRDGHYLLFASSGNGIMFATADGSGKPRLLLENSAVLAPWSLHPGGARLAYQVRSPETGQFDLWTVALEGSGMDLRAGKPEPFLTTPAVEVFPTFSPDGKWLAYLSNRSGAFEPYVRAFPGGTREIQLSRTGAMAFHWPRKASEIFYRSPNQTIMSVHYRGGSDTFELDAPRAWSDVDLADTGVFPNFDVTDDGRRVVALLPPGDPSAASLSQVTFAINFFAELQRRVGAGGH